MDTLQEEWQKQEAWQILWQEDEDISLLVGFIFLVEGKIIIWERDMWYL